MIRIGHNPNTNMLPMFYFLPQTNSFMERVTAEPTGHNAMLADGRIAMAPISAFSYGEHWQEYYILPNLSVSVKGRVGSLLLFSKVPLSDLQDKIVAFTDLSATTVNLTKILLHQYDRVFPHYLTMSADLTEMFVKADAALLIGDPAILAAAKQPDCLIYDLAEEWFKYTGCTMTAAVWAFPKRLSIERPQEVKAVYNLLIDAKEQALKHMEEIIEASVNMLGGSHVYWEEYFGRFYYGMNQEYSNGLQTYFDLCYELGLLSSKPRLSFWP
ncbi:MAG: menaquinone biosynthesis protein [Desulfitobacteriaceae bacterium]